MSTSNTCGVGGWGGPLPGDPSNNSILSASPAFGGIDVSWSLPTTNPFAVSHTLLYRGLLSNFNASIQIAAVAGNQYYDKSQGTQNLTQYYWIRHVSINGTQGELIGPASAIARPLIDQVIEQLSGKIDSSTLAQSLKTDIDRITLNEAAFTNEVNNRIAANNAFSTALTQVQASLAQTTSVVNQELIARQEGDSSLAAAILTAQSTFGTNIASVETRLQTNIDVVAGEVTNIGALYTAQVSVNGLIGGFGIYNNGTFVDAGFDVDRFWIGRTSSNKRKPFIVENGQVYIDQAVINQLTFSKLRDESGSVVVENGKIKADYINVNKILGGSFTGYNWPTTGDGFYLGPEGLLLGNYNTGRFLQVNSAGNIFSTNFNAVNGFFSFVGGRFTVDQTGYVVADRIAIRRRDAVATGTGVWGRSAYLKAWDPNEPYPVGDYEPYDFTFYFDTGIDDWDATNLSVNQKYSAMVNFLSGYSWWYGGAPLPGSVWHSVRVQAEVVVRSNFYNANSIGSVVQPRLFVKASVRLDDYYPAIYRIQLDNFNWSIFKI